MFTSGWNVNLKLFIVLNFSTLTIVAKRENIWTTNRVSEYLLKAWPNQLCGSHVVSEKERFGEICERKKRKDNWMMNNLCRGRERGRWGLGCVCINTRSSEDLNICKFSIPLTHSATTYTGYKYLLKPHVAMARVGGSPLSYPYLPQYRFIPSFC